LSGRFPEGKSGLVSNRLLALASGMGFNAMLAFSVIGFQQSHVPWQVGMAAVFVEGLIILTLVFDHRRDPPDFQHQPRHRVGVHPFHPDQADPRPDPGSPSADDRRRGRFCRFLRPGNDLNPQVILQKRLFQG
jgi:hypothetical protein